MDPREAMDQAECLAFINPGVRIVLKDIPDQLVPEVYKRIRMFIRSHKFDNGSKITVHTLPF